MPAHACLYGATNWQLQVAQAFAFFNVQNPAFYALLLGRMATARPEELTLAITSNMYMCALIRAAG
jgi:hypothetical protein